MFDFMNPAPQPANYVEDPRKVLEEEKKKNEAGKATVVQRPGQAPLVKSDEIDVSGFLHENPYKPIPTPVEVAQAPDPVVQEATKVLQEETERIPAAEPKTKSMGVSDWLVGATPLVVDFLMGGNGGTAIAADYFTKKGTDQYQSKDAYKLAIEKLKLQREQAKTGKATQLNKNQGAMTDKGWKTWNQINQDPSLKLVQGEDELLEAKQIGDYWDPNGQDIIKTTHSDAIQKGLRPFNGTKYSTDNRAGMDALKMKFAKEKKDAELANMAFDNQNSLLKSRESDPVTRGTRELATNFSSLQQAARRWAADPKSRAVSEQELVVKYLKSLDPTSVARESEQLGVINSKGALDTINSFPERLKLGQRLTGDQVRSIMESSKVRMQEQLKAQEQLDGSYLNRGRQFGWDIGYGLQVPKVGYEDYEYLRKIGGSSKSAPAKGTAEYEANFQKWKKEQGL